jgi:hypothetical protein
MPDNFFTDKEHISSINTFPVTCLVSAILWCAISKAGRFIYRLHTNLNDIKNE